jgi:hypothetical protein
MSNPKVTDIALDSPANLSSQFRWQTQDGRLLTLGQMVDRHLVNSMRMIYNNFLAKHGLDPVPGGKAWLMHNRSAEEWLRSIVAFMWEIEANRRLSPELARLYGMMKLRILEAVGFDIPWIRELQEEENHKKALLEIAQGAGGDRS